jgi:hypothetical protein
MKLDLGNGVRVPWGLLLYIEFLNGGAAYYFLQFSRLVPAAFVIWQTHKFTAIGVFGAGVFMIGCGLFEVFLFILLLLLDLKARKYAREQQRERSNPHVG